MCGIAGTLSFDPATRPNPDVVVAMRDVLEHRGPDGAGLFVDGPVALAHRRLAIVDVEGGAQPMSNEDGTVWVVFNGEIYNHADLRRDLIARGHAYRTRCDTETILHLYEEYGIDAVAELRGMFAFALWDRPKRRLLLARDRLGIKPLYYARTAGRLLFASEIKSILAGGAPAVLHPPALPEYFANRYVAGTATFFRDIFKVPPAHVLVCDDAGSVHVRRYWRLPRAEPETGRSIKDCAGELGDHLKLAVKRHLMSDVPLGVFLSGGIDSSALAAIAARLVGAPLQTFAVGFAEAEADELPYARMMAASIGAEHREVRLTPAAYFAELPRLIWNQDEPMAFSSGVPLHAVSRLAQAHVKVVLTGEGADELFLGYNRYRVTFWNEQIGRRYRAVVPASIQAEVRALVHRLPSRTRRYLDRTFLAVGADPRALFFENFSVFPPSLQRQLLPGLTADPYAFGLDCYTDAHGGVLERMSATDLQTYLVELLMKQDRMSMAASIESRVPFLDDTLLEHVAGLPGRLKLRGWRTKAVLREAVARLVPPAILTRRKMGFPVPLARWFRGAYWPVIEEFVLGSRARARGHLDDACVRRLAEDHRAGRANHAERLWLLLNLELWQRIFCEREAPAEVMTPVLRRLGRSNADPLDQDGWAVAAQHRRPAAHVSHSVGAVTAP